MLCDCLTAVRQAAPLVHNITNYVTANDVANILLACGASPIMADEPQEVEPITSRCDALHLNLGTLHQHTIPAMFAAGKRANALGHPVVLDPVGVGSSALRGQTAAQLREQISFAGIRANISEIYALAQDSFLTHGVDADCRQAVTEQTVRHQAEYITRLAEKFQTILVVTGAIDLVSDGTQCYIIRNGTAMMSRVTGTGCQLSGMLAAFLAANPQNRLQAAAAAVVTMGLAGEIAQSHLAPYEGNASYRNRLIDAVYQMTPAILQEGQAVEIL